MQSGTVFNIQRFSTHDGPGIRTTVFLKGCPLACWWCHNPESKQASPALLYNHETCLACGMCAKACTQGAIVLVGGTLSFDHDRCILCGRCSKRCPVDARELVGKRATVIEVLAEVEKDRIFYDESGGGVTFSGGEPLMQPEFLYELLRCCQERGIHTAVDTAGQAPWQVLAKISEVTNVFLYDIKHMNSARHNYLTGVPNDLIVDNLRRLSRIHHGILLRVPIITGFNDDQENLFLTGRLAIELKISRVHILPYHSIGSGKYTRLGEVYPLGELKPPSTERMQGIAKELESFGLTVTIGG